MDDHAEGHIPSGHFPSVEIHCCPTLTSQVCSMGFSYLAIRSGYSVCRMAVIRTLFMVSSVHLCHVIAHPVKLHGGSHEVELVQASHVCVERLLGAWLYTLAHQGAVHTGGTLAYKFLK